MIPKEPSVFWVDAVGIPRDWFSYQKSQTGSVSFRDGKIQQLLKKETIIKDIVRLDIAVRSWKMDNQTFTGSTAYWMLGPFLSHWLSTALRAKICG